MTDTPSEPPKARFRGTRWPGMIWAVPVAAAGIVLWLGLEAVAKRGPTVTVEFPTAGGLKPGSTTVKYRGVTVGHVSAVHLTKSLDSMKVSMRFMGDMAGHLGAGTSFWIAGRSISFSNLSSLKTVIAGPYIGVAPHDGKVAKHFTGLPHAPVLRSGARGETLRIIAAHPGNLARGAGIYFNHAKIGKVIDVAMRPDGTHFVIRAFIDRSHENLVSASSRFWNAGGISLHTGGSGPKIMLQSVPALLSGALGVETPPGGGKPDKHTIYHLYSGHAAALAAPGPHAVRYRVVLAGGPHGLQQGAKVTLEGAKAGVVTGVGMRFDPEAGKLVTTVKLALEPHDLPLASPHHWHLSDPAPQMNALLASLISHGLRARMTRATPVIGAQTIALDLVRHAPAAALGTGNEPEIPSTTATSIKAIMAQVSGILANIHDATSRVAAVSRSPRTRRTLERLDRTITHVDAITRTTSTQLPQLLANLRQSTRAADSALRSVHGLLAEQGTAANAPESESLPHALYELTRAARSLRELTDYLSGHPNAVIFGKGR